jgi:anti-sigma factor RsiW
LQGRYAEIFGEQARTKNRTWLLKRIAWRLQALAEGDQSERARRRAAVLANDADLRTTLPKVSVASVPAERIATRPLRCQQDERLPPGTVLTRPYEGHARAFAFFGDVTTRISYDNSKIALVKLIGPHERRLTREFLRLAPLPVAGSEQHGDNAAATPQGSPPSSSCPSGR